MTHREKREVAIAKAEQQILGFAHRHEGFSFRDLSESMGLKKKEWETIKEECPHYKEKKWLVEEIDEYFEEKDIEKTQG